MKIHHYTSIETLEMILKNKSIKFNRLDQVDDKAEYKYDSTVYDTNIKLGKYTFVSCWTKSEMENIDLWNRYGKVPWYGSLFSLGKGLLRSIRCTHQHPLKYRM